MELKKYRIWQIQFDSAEVNRHKSWDRAIAAGVEGVEAHVEMSTGGGRLSRWKDSFWKDYAWVGTIYCHGLEDAFCELNGMGNGHAKVEDRLPRRSLSVGDILQDEDGLRHIVSSIGFSTIPNMRGV